MIGVTHLVAAVTASSLVLGPEIDTIAISAVGGIMPDIDHPHSTVGRKIPILPELFNIFFGHRTLTHSLLGLLGISFFLYIKNPVWGQAWLIGYGSHLLLDFLTVSGVPFFWPIPKCYSIGITKTGGMLDILTLASLVMINFLTPWGKTNWIEVFNSISFLSP